MASFAEAYDDQTERDHEQLVERNQDGQDRGRGRPVARALLPPVWSRRGARSGLRAEDLEGRVEVFTAIACLFGITALLSFVNDRYLRLQTDIGLLLLAVVTTLLLRVSEAFVPTGAIGVLHAYTHAFNLNEGDYILAKPTLESLTPERGQIGVLTWGAKKWTTLRKSAKN